VILPRPPGTDALRTAHLAIRELAAATDAALSVLAVALVGDRELTTNQNGDLTLTFPTLQIVTGVILNNVSPLTTGTTTQKLQVPVWCLATGAPAGTAWVRAFSTLTNAALPNHPVRVNGIAWGVPV